MTANRDIMSVALAAVYGPDNNLADWEAQHWVAEGFEPCGPGDKAAWYAAEGASGSSYGDLEYDYWSNVYAGGGGGGVAPSNTVAPALDVSTLTAGGTVTVSDGTWTGDATITYTYQWQSSPTGLGSWTDISGATSDSLVSTETQVDTWVRCVVTGTNGVGNSSANSGTCAIQHVFTALGGTWWIDAAREVASGASSTSQWALNRGSTSVPHARLGSTGRAELRGSYGLVLPGVTGNDATSPDSAALDVADDIEIIVRVTIGSISTNQGIVSKFTASNWVYELRVQSTDLFFYGSGNGTSTTLSTVSGAHGLSVGDTVWLRATRVKSTGVNTIYKAADQASIPTSWTQIATQTLNAGASFFNGANPVRIGSSEGSAFPFAGSIYRAIIRSSIDGTTVFDADFTTASAFATSFTESSSNAATVTINATSGSDTNDPLLLTHSGTNYLYLPGTDNNNASASTSAALNVTGDLELVVRLAATDWTSGSSQSIIGKRGSGATNLGYYVRVTTAGTIALLWGVTSGSVETLTSTAAVPFADGAAGWLKVTRNSTTGTAQFFTAADQASEPSSWTQLGADVAGTAGASQTNSDPLIIGAAVLGSSSAPLAGVVFRAIVRDGIDGTTVFDADFTANTNQSSFTESSSNAATVTINRATSGRKAVMVTRPVWLFGTDDYMEVADNAMLDMGASQDFALVTVGRQHATWANSDRQISKRNNAGGLGYVLANTSTSGQFETYIQHGGGLGSDFQTGATLGTLYLAASVRSGSDVTTYIGTTGSGTTVSSADLSNSVAMRVGADPDSVNYLDGEIVAVAVFRSALDSTALASIASYFGV